MTDLAEALTTRGWQKLPADMRNRRIADIPPHGDAQFIKDGTILSISNGALAASPRGGVSYYDDSGIVINAIYVQPEDRGKGKARGAMADLMAALGDTKWPDTMLYVEPCPIGGMTAGLDEDQIAAWYGRLGFASYDGAGCCLRRPASGAQ